MAGQTSEAADCTVVYLARHGQTPLNESGALRGLADPRWTGPGASRPGGSGTALGPRSPSLVLASPLR